VLNEDQEIGVVTGFETNMSQDILVVNEKILIPLIKEFLVKIDDENKIVFMKLPPGLLEVNQ
jgi:ribosomal 30S subunit maturation factor RimM